MTARPLAAAVLAAGLSLFAPARAAAEAPALEIPQLDAAPSLGGTIDETWAKAATVQMGWDVQYNRAADPSATRVHVARYRDVIYVAFDNRAARAPTTTQRTDGSGVFNDDNDQVLLWPGGTSGFAYTFAANALGTRYQSSSENTAYTPTWSAAARRSAGGYVVQMAIPLAALRYTGNAPWRVQFVRVDVATGSAYEWAYDRRQQSAGDVLYAGVLKGIDAQPVSVRPQPRLQFYALGEQQPQQIGGSTSRIGADLSLPLSRTSSFLASFHPDFSNVEIDQQTIAPTEFQRKYREVRPFFTQGAGFYNVSRCISCPYQVLYTPAIPTFREGYAVEGQAGLVGFGAFDALGTARNDQAQSVSYRTSNQTFHAEAERVAVTTADGFHDVVTLYGTGYANPHSHLAFFANYGQDRGSGVDRPGEATYADVGASIRSATASLAVTLRKLGAQFNPADGYVALEDIAGWAAQGYKQVSFKESSLLRDISVNAFIERYHAHTGRVNQDDAGYQMNFDFRGSTTLHVFQSNSYLLLGNGEFLPFSQNGAYLGYRYATSTPTGILLQSGPFYHGRSSYVSYSTGLALARRFNLLVEADRTAYGPSRFAAGEPSTNLWLERMSLDWQATSRSSLDIGVRRIRGYLPPDSFDPPSKRLLDATNVSFALHTYSPKRELYLVYGDPNVLRTKPAVTVKLIWYIGAPKGT
jgi:hypothetical protein